MNFVDFSVPACCRQVCALVAFYNSHKITKSQNLTKKKNYYYSLSVEVKLI